MAVVDDFAQIVDQPDIVGVYEVKQVFSAAQAMEAAGRRLFDLPDAPWEFQIDMARTLSASD